MIKNRKKRNDKKAGVTRFFNVLLIFLIVDNKSCLKFLKAVVFQRFNYLLKILGFLRWQN